MRLTVDTAAEGAERTDVGLLAIATIDDGDVEIFLDDERTTVTISDGTDQIDLNVAAHVADELFGRLGDALQTRRKEPG
ncbi:MAG: hypothetical protein OXP08_03200 [bacterium]|nr:hypothetical protein [bacterium]